jgi:hypothetical protein
MHNQYKIYCFVAYTPLNMFRALLCPSSGAPSNCLYSHWLPYEGRVGRASSCGRFCGVEVTSCHKHAITQECFFKQIPASKCLNWLPCKITFLKLTWKRLRIACISLLLCVGWVQMCECVYVSGLSEQFYHDNPFLPTDLFVFLQQESRRREKQLHTSDKFDYAERNGPLLWTRLI